MSDIKKDFLDVIEAINNSVKKANLEDKTDEINEANKLNSAIKDYVKASENLVPYLKNDTKNDKLSSTIEMIGTLMKEKVLKELDVEVDKIKEITNKIVPEIVDDIKAKYKTEIDNLKDITENRTKIYDTISKQIDIIRDQLMNNVYIKKAFEVYSSEEIDDRIGSLKAYFNKGK